MEESQVSFRTVKDTYECHVYFIETFIAAAFPSPYQNYMWFFTQCQLSNFQPLTTYI